MYDRILLPTDGSTAVNRALDHAVPLARAHDATLYVVYVVDTRMTAAVGPDAADAVLDSLRDDGERALDRVRARLNDEGVDYETELREAHPHTGVTFAAEDHGVDLIVMATRGRGSTGSDDGRSGSRDDGGLGSVTRRVVDADTWPVLVVPVDGAPARR